MGGSRIVSEKLEFVPETIGSSLSAVHRFSKSHSPHPPHSPHCVFSASIFVGLPKKFDVTYTVLLFSAAIPLHHAFLGGETFLA